MARIGLAVQNTVLEPGWSGYLTLELTNHGNQAIMLRDKMPIAQVIFHQGKKPKNLYEGRYQNQKPAQEAKDYYDESNRRL